MTRSVISQPMHAPNSLLILGTLLASTVGTAQAGPGTQIDPCLGLLIQQEFAFTSRVLPVFSGRFMGNWDGKMTYDLSLHRNLDATVIEFGSTSAASLDPSTRVWTHSYSFKKGVEVDGYPLVAEMRMSLTKGYDNQCWFEARPDDRTLNLSDLTEQGMSEAAIKSSPDWVGAPTCDLILDATWKGFDDSDDAKAALMKKAKRLLHKGKFNVVDATSKATNRYRLDFDWKDNGSCDLALHKESTRYIREDLMVNDVKVSAQSCGGAIRKIKKALTCEIHSAE